MKAPTAPFLALALACSVLPAQAAPAQVDQAILYIRGGCTLSGTTLSIRPTNSGRLTVRLAMPDGQVRAVNLTNRDVGVFTERSMKANANQPFELGACTEPHFNEVISKLISMPDATGPDPLAQAAAPAPSFPAAPPAQPAVVVTAPPPTTTTVVAVPPPAVVATAPQPSTAGQPRYADARLAATGMTSSLANDGRRTVIPVRIENLSDQPLLLGHDREAITVITDTGETTFHPNGCGLVGIRQVHLGQLSPSQEINPRNYTQVMPQGSAVVSLSCDLKTDDVRRIGSLNVNMPLIRLEGGSVVRFTVSLAGVPVNR